MPANVMCVHGHFLPFKYRRLASSNTHFVTWIRDPVDRLRSHYDYWRSEFYPESAGRTHRKMISEHWSFERFALGPELRSPA